MRQISIFSLLLFLFMYGCFPTQSRPLPFSSKHSSNSYDAKSRILPLPPLAIYQDQTGPTSYVSPVLSEIPQPIRGEVVEIEGESCQQGISIPIASLSFGWDEGGYKAALNNAMKESMVERVYDVRADTRYFNVIGVYQELCTVVHAKGIRPFNEAPPTSTVQDKSTTTPATETELVKPVQPSQGSPATVAAPSSTPNAKAPEVEVVICRRTLVFKGPGANYDSVGILQEGCKIKVMEESGNWYRFSSKEFPSAWILKIATRTP